MTVIHKLAETVRVFHSEAQNWKQEESKLQALTQQLEDDLSALAEQRHLAGAVRETHPISALSQALHQQIRAALTRHRDAWQQAAPVRTLCQAYEDRVILLVFGKVNAGKSTLINFLAEQLAPELGEPRFFVLENGVRRTISGPLASGVTETTATIQGVELGQSLVLLDTPGMHSVTPENAALAKRFTDAADAVLWLTNSVAPGQVQELDDLKAELSKRLPLLPVISASDRIEVDCDEQGTIVHRRYNKRPEVRAEQEDDVWTRAREKLAASALAAQLRQPISISVMMCQEAGGTTEALRESGIERLLTEMIVLVEEAQHFKNHKARQYLVNHLERNVLAPLREQVLPSIAKIVQLTEKERQNLRERHHILKSQFLAEIGRDVLTIVGNHVHDQDESAVAAEISRAVAQSFKKMATETFEHYLCNVESQLIAMAPVSDIGQFRRMTETCEFTERSWAEPIGSGVGAIAGALAGAFLGPLGTLAGSFLGSYVGGRVGAAFRRTRVQEVVVGIDSAEIETRAFNWAQQQGSTLIDTFVKTLDQSLAEAARNATRLHRRIETFAGDIDKLKITIGKKGERDVQPL
ncbi:MAG TPA: 50S ribosome-binding GTPase [Hydrogenophilus thermoluteolus]|nr:50S ribosome-binding GTPase [Hydrogenophilus thermoluteolus]HNU19365.1 50S ribosome-binding GTPase [Hydrogenophilus thermoluteolus]